MANEPIRIGPYSLSITHPEKMLFPDDGITKREFVDYYLKIAGVMIPHIKGRPVNMHRFMEGIKGEGYYQQAIPETAPDWVQRVPVKKEDGIVTHIVCDNPATLIYMANQDCITPHVWLSKMDKLETPDQIIFDLDPPGNDFEPVREGAQYLKKLLDEIGLKSFLKTTGSHGLHVAIPIIRSASFETARSFARQVAEKMALGDPEKYTTEIRKEKRKNRVFIDTLRNAYAHTAVAPYAVRANKGAPIAAPLYWEELKEADLTAQRYNIRNIFDRLKQTGDPWNDMAKHSQSLDRPRRKLAELKP